MKPLFSLISVASLFLFSCSKDKLTSQGEVSEEYSTGFNIPSNGPVGRLQLLTREVSFTSNSPSLKQVREFLYDTDNRCTQIKIGTIDSSGNVPPVFNISRVFTFIYEGNNPLPEKVQSARTVFPNLVTEFFYEYDEDGNKINDSVRVLNQAGQPADRNVRYKYIGKDSIISTPEFVNFPIFNNPFDTLVIDKSNLIRLIRRTLLITGSRLNTYDFEYDNNVNPYNALNIYNSFYLANPAIGIANNVFVQGQYAGISQNNIIAYTQDIITEFVIDYTYDKFKYPVKSEFYLSGSTFKTTTYFSYKGKHDH
jgi:hypothetical protein